MALAARANHADASARPLEALGQTTEGLVAGVARQMTCRAPLAPTRTSSTSNADRRSRLAEPRVRSFGEPPTFSVFQDRVGIMEATLGGLDDACCSAGPLRSFGASPNWPDRAVPIAKVKPNKLKRSA
jgi:hypothetical protein